MTALDLFLFVSGLWQSTFEYFVTTQTDKYKAILFWIKIGRRFVFAFNGDILHGSQILKEGEPSVAKELVMTEEEKFESRYSKF